MVGFSRMPQARMAVLVWCLCEMSVSAHHSTLAFDGTHPTVVSGVVATFNWAYPHTSIVLDVSDSEGTIIRWTIESESLQMLSRLGWTQGSIKPGDRIRVTGARARNGAPAMRCRTIDLPDGKSLSCFPIEEGP
jgi:uncharacterized protein DUF6152